MQIFKGSPGRKAVFFRRAVIVTQALDGLPAGGGRDRKQGRTSCSPARARPGGTGFQSRRCGTGQARCLSHPPSAGEPDISSAGINTPCVSRRAVACRRFSSSRIAPSSQPGRTRSARPHVPGKGVSLQTARRTGDSEQTPVPARRIANSRSASTPYVTTTGRLQAAIKLDCGQRPFRSSLNPSPLNAIRSAQPARGANKTIAIRIDSGYKNR